MSLLAGLDYIFLLFSYKLENIISVFYLFLIIARRLSVVMQTTDALYRKETSLLLSCILINDRNLRYTPTKYIIYSE